MSPLRDAERMHTTTVRFDWELWGRICETAELLGVAHAAFIRDATREHLARIDHTDRLSQLEQQVGELMRTVANVSARLRELFRRRS